MLRTLLSLFLLSCITQSVLGVQFAVGVGLERCVSEDGAIGDLIMLEYALKPNGVPVVVTVVDPIGSRIYDKTSQSNGDDRFRFAHTSSKVGEYKLCFYNRNGNQPAYVDFSLTIGQNQNAATDKDLAKKESLKPMESKLKQLEGTVNSILTEMKALQIKEEQMRKLNDSTSSRVITFSIISTVLLMILKGFEIVYLRGYFKSRRMIQ